MTKFNEDKSTYFDYSEEKYKMFSEDTQKFIKSMCYMATIESINLDKDRINTEIKTIQTFIKKCKSANNSVNNMFGFKEEIEELEFGTKEYYFFIADIKIKSTVYILRIENFLANWADFNSVEKRREIFLNSLEDMRVSDLKTFFQIKRQTSYDQNKISDIKNEKISSKEHLRPIFWKEDIADEDELFDYEKIFEEFCKLILAFLEEKEEADIKRISQIYREQKERISVTTSENKDQKESDFEDELQQMSGIISFDNAIGLFSESQKDQDLKSIEYYLFDNSMNEVNFCGVEWNWLWRYERGEEDLFRCVGTDSFAYYDHYNGEKRRLYYQNMIRNIVIHMNKGNSGERNKLASYSKNPFRDIYKYMISQYEDNSHNVDYFFKIIVENNDIRASLIDEGHEIKPIIFAMIKNANTNIIKKINRTSQADYDFCVQNIFYKCTSSDSIDFSGFVLGEDDPENEYNFCVDIFNTQETYSGDVRRVFREYTLSFPKAKVPHHQMSVVAPSDNEVVMLGNTCNKIEKSLLPEGYKDCKENIEYRVELNKNEVLSLFYKMHILCNRERVNIKPKLIFKGDSYYCNAIPLIFEDDNTHIFVGKLKKYLKNLNAEEAIKSIKQLVGDDKYKQIDLAINIYRIIEQQNDDIDKVRIVKNIKQTLYEFEKNIKQEIKDCIITRVRDISSDKVDLILSFLLMSEYRNSPSYGNNTYKKDKDHLVALYRELFLK